jgi:hypothetical protein
MALIGELLAHDVSGSTRPSATAPGWGFGATPSGASGTEAAERTPTSAPAGSNVALVFERRARIV